MVFQVYAGGFGTESKTANSKCSISSGGQQVAEGEGGEGMGRSQRMTGKVRRGYRKWTKYGEVDGWIDGKMDGGVTFHGVYPILDNLTPHSLDN